MRAAEALRELGVTPGERVALLMHDCAELVSTFLGAVRIGAVPVPLNVLLRPLELRTLLNHCGAVEVVASGDLAKDVDAVRNEVPSLRHLLTIGGAHPGQIDFSALVRDVEPWTNSHEPDDGVPAFLLYSGAQNGEPRAVAQDHAAPRHAFDAYARAVLQLGPADRVLSSTKLSTAYGLGLGLLFPLMAGAATFLIPGRTRPRTLFDVLAAFAPTVFAATPSIYAQLAHDFAELPQPRPNLMASVRHAISGGEMLPIAVEKRVRELFGVDLLHGFGVTDALCFVLSNRPEARRALSVGRPLAGIGARLLDENGAPVPPQEIGALELRGPTFDGPLLTGDRFLVDADGYYFYCGRGDDLFKVSGRWVAPGEVERALLLHPAVWECAVVEDRDDDGLPLPHAFVVTNVGHTGSDELARELMRFVKDEIAPYKYPRQVSFVDTLPRAPDGKVQRWKLRGAVP
ncbi:MAG: AMP-dependent synthetase and ligase [Myxococcales bacterium]|nr:AMP-dependent synthetase and ligase [Myxococcales bacterium]